MGGWCGTYQDRLYPSKPDWRFVSYFQFCEDGSVLVDLTGIRTPGAYPAFSHGKVWGKWEETTEGYAFTTQDPWLPKKFPYKLMGHWHLDGDEATYTVWEVLYPKFTDGWVKGSAERCEEKYPCAPVYPDIWPHEAGLDAGQSHRGP